MLQPIGKRVLVQIIENEEVSKSGILLATEEEFDETKGIIIAVGDETYLKELKLEIGDTVIIDDLAAEEFRDTENNKKIKLKILGVEHIIAKVIDQAV